MDLIVARGVHLSSLRKRPERCVRVVLTLSLTLSLFLGAAFSQTETLSLNETFSSAHLAAEDSAEIIAAIENSAYDVPDSWLDELRVRRVDLGHVPGLVVQGTNLLCGGTGNCQLWVLRKVAGKWTSLFASEQAPIAEGFSLGPTVTHGVKDLTIISNEGADISDRVIYKFDGKAYQPSRGNP